MKHLLKVWLLLAIVISSHAQALELSGNDSLHTIHSKTVVFITGAFVSNSGWDEWKAYFESKGYKTLAPAWPYKEGSVEALRKRHPDKNLAALSLESVVDYHADLIAKLPEKPIIIGHSFGGLIVQKLMQRGVAEAGIAYHSVPPKGVVTLKHSFIKSLWKPLGIFKSRKTPYLMTFKHWQYTFTNGMALEEQRAFYDKLVIPESRVLMRDALKKPGKVDFKKPLAPMLFVGGTEDHIMPAKLDKKIYTRYKKHAPKNAILAYKEFPNTNHLAMSQPGWKAETDFIMDWVNKHRSPATLSRR